MIADSTTILTDLQKIPGFEGTDYAYLHGDIVWAGEHASTDHPRNAFSMWQPKTISFRADKLIEGALICNTLFSSNHPLASQAKGLLLWLQSIDMPFPMNLSAARFDAIKHALIANDLHAFTAASLRVLGLGDGLTPSGDDFIGGIFFALAHAPRQAWIADLTAAKNHIQLAAKSTTNVISAALLDDMMTGCSYSALHDVLAALNSQDIEKINTSCNKLLTLGASSGADMLAGLLLALTTQNQSLNH